MILHVDKLNYDLIHDTLNTFVKFEEDVKLVKEQLRGMAEKALNMNAN